MTLSLSLTSAISILLTAVHSVLCYFSIFDTFEQNKQNASTNLFAIAVGIKQKDLVNKMVKKVT